MRVAEDDPLLPSNVERTQTSTGSRAYSLLKGAIVPLVLMGAGAAVVFSNSNTLFPSSSSDAALEEHPAGESSGNGSPFVEDPDLTSSTPFQMYKVTLVVPPGTGKATRNFFDKYISPPVHSLPVELGCDGKRYMTTLLNQQLHWVDAAHMERGDHHSDYWADYFTELNGDLTSFNAFMHSKTVLYVPDLYKHYQRLQDDSISVFKRLGYDEDNEKVAHIGISVMGRMYELVGPASTIDTDDFSEWSDDECVEAHSIGMSLKAYEKVYKKMLDKDEEQDDDAMIKIEDWSLPTPMIIAVGSALDDLDTVTNGLEHLKIFTGARNSYHDYGACQVLKTTWSYDDDDDSVATMLSVPLISVVHNSAPTGKHTVTDYLDYLWEKQHLPFAANYLKKFGDNWDHWLDYHLGFSVSGLDVGSEMASKFHDLIHKELKDNNWPVGYRHGGRTGGANSNTTDYHFYTGYRNTYAFEYFVEYASYQKEEVNLCACVPENNARVFYEEDRAKEITECDWYEGDFS